MHLPLLKSRRQSHSLVAHFWFEARDLEIFGRLCGRLETVGEERRQPADNILLAKVAQLVKKCGREASLTDCTSAIRGRLFSDAIAVMRFCFKTGDLLTFGWNGAPTRTC
jgi:hypothetical protein